MGAGVIQGLLRGMYTQRGIIALLLFTLAVRSSLMYLQFAKLREDPDRYYLIGSNIVHFASFSIEDPTNVGRYASEMRPSAFRPPLYPIILSNLATGKDKLIYWESIAILHICLALATVWTTWRIAQSLNLGWGSYLAGMLIACDPILLNYQSQVMTETLATFCSVVAWGLLTRFHFDRNWWNAGLAGGALGMAALCRPTFLPWLALSALIVLCMQPGKLDDKTVKKRNPLWNLRTLNFVALLVGGLGVMFPWAWRNYRQFQSPMLTTTHGGYTLYLANNRHFYRFLREDTSGLPWEPRAQRMWTPSGSLAYRQSFRDERRYELFEKSNAPFSLDKPNDERAIDKYQSQLAFAAMAEDPAGLILASLYRVRQLWTPLAYRVDADESLNRTMFRYLSAAWYCGVYALALAGVVRLRWELLRSPWVFGVAVCLIFTAVHTLYWCNQRMRAPLMPFVAVMAGAGSLEISRHALACGSKNRGLAPSG